MQGDLIMSTQLKAPQGGHAAERESFDDRNAAWLPEGWIYGRDCEIGGPPGHPVRVELALMHPLLGVALIDTRTVTVDGEEVLRSRLAETQFAAIFNGYLPVLNGSVEPAELPSIATILTNAFAELPQLTVAGGDAWLATLTRVVVPGDRHWFGKSPGAPSEKRSDDWMRPATEPLWERTATVVPLRRVSTKLPAGTGHGDIVPLPQQTAYHHRSRWAAAGAACLGVTVIAAFAFSQVAPEPKLHALSVPQFVVRATEERPTDVATDPLTAQLPARAFIPTATPVVQVMPAAPAAAVPNSVRKSAAPGARAAQQPAPRQEAVQQRRGPRLVKPGHQLRGTPTSSPRGARGRT
jgi:hypothetical protein